MTTRKLQELKAQLIEEYKAGKELSDKNYYVYERPNGTYQVRRKRENNKEPEPAQVETITQTEKNKLMKQWEKDKKALDLRLKEIEAKPVRVRKSKSPEKPVEIVQTEAVKPAPDPSEDYKEPKEAKPHVL